MADARVETRRIVRSPCNRCSSLSTTARSRVQSRGTVDRSGSARSPRSEGRVDCAEPGRFRESIRLLLTLFQSLNQWLCCIGASREHKTAAIGQRRCGRRGGAYVAARPRAELRQNGPLWLGSATVDRSGYRIDPAGRSRARRWKDNYRNRCFGSLNGVGLLLPAPVVTGFGCDPESGSAARHRWPWSRPGNARRTAVSRHKVNDINILD